MPVSPSRRREIGTCIGRLTTWRALCLWCSLPAFVAGREHGRTIPLADFRESRPVVPAWNPVCCTWVTDFFVKFCMLKERDILDSRECWSFFDEEVSAGCGRACCTGAGGSRLGRRYRSAALHQIPASGGR